MVANSSVNRFSGPDIGLRSVAELSTLLQRMSASTTIRVRETTRHALSELAQKRGSSITDVVDQLVEAAAADAMFDAHNEAMALGPETGLEGTLRDGLDEDPWPLDERGRPAR